jgi:hypothetical protein
MDASKDGPSPQKIAVRVKTRVGPILGRSHFLKGAAMPPNDPLSFLNATGTAATWPPDDFLDLEPEICCCLRHGHELPCAACERAGGPAAEAIS